MTVRRLVPTDDAAFRRLLEAVYGATYSYRDLYQPGGLGRLLAGGRALCFGDFDEQGELFSHTAFLLKDPGGDHVESGMSLRNPRLRTAGRTPDAEIWPRLLAELDPSVVYVHQHTTTWHTLAQRYAVDHMHARPTGLVVDYALGEQLACVSAPPAMQALTMTSRLGLERDPGDRLVLVPDGAWGRWLAELFETWGRAPRSHFAPAATRAVALKLVEENPWLDLRRRAVVALEPTGPGEPLEAGRPRTDLLHLPTDERVGAFALLLEAGYLPVGVRPHASRLDEIVLQHLPRGRRGPIVSALRAARIHGERSARILHGWIDRCTRAS